MSRHFARSTEGGAQGLRDARPETRVEMAEVRQPEQHEQQHCSTASERRRATVIYLLRPESKTTLRA